MKKQKFLLDENIGFLVVKLLRQCKYDVVSILEIARGITDTEVLAKAVAEERIVVTLDKDFGKLVFVNSKKHVGVIFLRLRKDDPHNIFDVLHAILETYKNTLQKKFTIASEGHIRIKG